MMREKRPNITSVVYVIARCAELPIYVNEIKNRLSGLAYVLGVVIVESELFSLYP